MLRQFNLGQWGVPDLLTFDVWDTDVLKVQIVELKKDCVGFKALGQALRYKVGVTEVFRRTIANTPYQPKTIRFEIILIGSKIDEWLGFSRNFLSKDIRVYTYRFDPFEGIEFNYHAYTGYKKEANMPVNPLPKEVVEGISQCHLSNRDFDAKNPFQIKF